MASRSCTALPIPVVIEIGAAGDAYFAVSERAPCELLDGLRDLDVSGTEGYGLWTRDGKTALRKGVTRRRAADLLFVLTGPALYRDFVIEAGWTLRDWTRWVAGALLRDLFPDR
jgi:hypothetical protein